MKFSPRNIIISRTDSIGDVVLTLPVAAALKKHFPECRIAFLGKAYTRPVIEACRHIDAFIDISDFLEKPVTVGVEQPDCIIHVFPVPAIAKRAKQLGIRVRIGTTNRFYHWFTCNRLVKLSRKNSDLHESQLNLALLRPLGVRENYSLQQTGAMTGIEKLKQLPAEFRSLIQPEKYNLILHPKSQGSGMEWPLERYAELVKLLDPQRYTIFISGTAKERALLQPLFDKTGNAVTDITGKLSLDEFIAFIAACDGLLAASTGPVHIAAALGKDAFGLYPPRRPLHPGRWAPIGPNVRVFVADSAGNDCMSHIQAVTLLEALEKKQKLKP